MNFEDLITKYSFLSESMYHITKSGIWICEKEVVKDGDAERIEWKPKKTICSNPIIPTAILDNPDEAVQKVEVSYWDMHRWKRKPFPRETLVNKNKVTALANVGIPVGTDNAREIASYFNFLLGNYSDKIPRKTSLTHLGWVDVETDGEDERVFAPYTDKVVFDNQMDNGAIYESIREKGDAGEWFKVTRELRKNLPLRLTMAAAFASPLIEVIGENPFILHLWGGTGSGKTVSILVAMSIWGNPRMGKLTRTMNMTVNSMLSTAAFLNSLPFAGDELQTIKSKWGNYDDMIMCVTEGINRGRMKFDKLTPTLSWHCTFIFSGEEPCVKEDSGGGAVNRVVQIEASEKIVEKGNATANFVRQNYGHAGKDYIDYVKILGNAISTFYEDYKRDILKETNTTEKQAGAMALLMTADYIASARFWEGEELLTVDDVKKYLTDATTVDVSERAWAFVCSTIAQYGMNFEKDAREAWGKREGESVYFIKSVLLDKLGKAGFDFEAVKRKWTDRGYLSKTNTDRYVHYVSINGYPAYCIKLNVPEPKLEYSKDELPF